MAPGGEGPSGEFLQTGTTVPAPPLIARGSGWRETETAILACGRAGVGWEMGVSLSVHPWLCASGEGLTHSQNTPGRPGSVSASFSLWVV